MSETDPRWTQAEDALYASRVLLDEGLYRDCVSRAYYAMFNAAQALLHADGYDPETHKGTLVLLDKHYVKDGRMAAQITQTLRQAFDLRQLADYSENPVSPSEAVEMVETAEAFLERIQEHMGGE